MKKYLSILAISLGLLSVSETALAAGPFFLDRIVQNQSIEDRFAKIRITASALKNPDTNGKLTQTRLFLAQVKKEALRRYENGLMTRYETEDVAHELEYLAYSMNEYFRNMRSYERTKNRAYLNLADQNLDDAAASYDRLSDITWQSVRR